MIFWLLFGLMAVEGLILVFLTIFILKRVSALQPTINIQTPEKLAPSREDIALAVFAALVAQKRPADENTLKQAQTIADNLFLPSPTPLATVDVTSVGVVASP